MIIDAHCHAWNRWPYQPPVPDPASRGAMEQLYYEMERNGVDQAVIVCARLEGNRTNNEYVAGKARTGAAGKRIFPFFDMDSCWLPSHHRPGAARRLKSLLRQWPIRGITHYLRRNDDGAWLNSADANAMFQVVAENNLVFSLSCYPHQHPAIRTLGRCFPSIPILCHHLGHISPAPRQTRRDLQEVCRSARTPNIFIKVSGFPYCSRPTCDFPYPDAMKIFRGLYEHFGARRMCWGSDYPVVRNYATYQQALHLVKTHCDFLSAQDKAWILGATMGGLLDKHE